jgi:hypothetical protein|tara:strand:- start:5827 stop:6069 length:243 start_codon:yes stop_codon:yes gene_type:complete
MCEIAQTIAVGWRTVDAVVVYASARNDIFRINFKSLSTAFEVTLIITSSLADMFYGTKWSNWGTPYYLPFLNVYVRVIGN